jgi:hypothetical protein
VFLGLLIAALLGVARPIPPASAAATIVVSTCDEASLQQAITSAQPGDTVTFGCSGTITLHSARSSEFDVTQDLTIDGAGQNVIIDGGGQTSAFFVEPNVTLTLRGLAFTGGVGGSFGLCETCGNIDIGGVITNQSGTVTISNSTFNNNISTGLIGGGAVLGYGGGTVNVSNSTFSSNTAYSAGGAIQSISGELNVTNSTFSGNLTREAGGAIQVSSGKATISNSTFSDNTANAYHANGSGGAISNTATMTIINSTFSGNIGQAGGAIANSGTLTVTFSTLAGNTAELWANGILTGTRADTALAGGGNTLIINSILANGPVTGNDGTFDFGGNCVSNGTFSVGGTYSDDGSCENGINVSTADLKLGALASNGGPTQTMALGAGSVAIHKDLCRPDVTTDQRGYGRLTAGLGCTPGAYEFGATAPVLTTALSAVSGSGPFAGTATLSATLATSGAGLSGKSVAFTLNGAGVGSATTGSNGVATLTGVSLAGINGGSYPSAIGASFTGDAGYTSSSGGGDLTVSAIGQTISFDLSGLPAKTAGDPPFDISSSASASSGLAVRFGSATENVCTVSGGTVTIVAAGSCTINANQDGNSNYQPAQQGQQSFSIMNPSPPVTTASAVTADDAAYTFGSWTNQVVTVSLSAVGNGGPGVANSYYALDGGNQTTYSMPITISSDGSHTLTFWSVDNASNEETPHQSVSVMIDLTAPTISGTATTDPNTNGWYNSSVTIHWTCSDTGSGIASCPSDQTISTEGLGQTVNGTSVDIAGNSTNVSSPAVSIDLTVPINVSTAPDRSPDHDGWYNHALVVTSAAQDALSGIASCTQQTYSGPDNAMAQASGTCTDNAGNVSAPVTFDFKYDASAPIAVAGTADRAPNSNGWFNAPVTIAFSGEDAISGIASCEQVDYSGPDSASAAVPGSCTDEAGNTSTTASFDLKYDASAPLNVAGAADRLPDSNGWYNHAVGITFTGQDAISEIASCTITSYAGADSATARVSGSCTDDAGNMSTPVSFELRYDASAPTSVAAGFDREPDHNGWYNHAVQITFNGTDATSGIASCTDVSYSAPDSASASVSGSCTDVAGNESTSTDASFKYDATATTNLVATPDRAPNDAGWYNAPVSFSVTGDDATSGIDTCAPVTYSGPDNAGAIVSGGCTDLAGNTSTISISIAYDTTVPVITFSGNAGNYTILQAVSITCAASDDLSGLAKTDCQNIDALASTLNTGNNTATATATDAAGNTGSGTVTFTVTATVDDLTTLTEQYVGNRLMASFLSAPLQGIALAERIQNPRLQVLFFKMYSASVNLQRGRTLTEQEADTLIRLARTL